jgi:hypothetical protein
MDYKYGKYKSTFNFSLSLYYAEMDKPLFLSLIAVID